MKLAFLFLDECSYAPLDLAALTGVLVPADRYTEVRDAMCRLVVDVLPKAPNVVPAAIELHGCSLLQDVKGEAGDSERLNVLNGVVDIVSKNRLTVCRSAYCNRSEMAARMRSDPNQYGTLFLNVQFWLQGIMADTLVVPVMDGIPDTSGMEIPRGARINPVLIRAFAGSVRWIHHSRQYPCVAEHLSIANANNLGEPLFADSAHSVLLQLVDLVSHMLLQRERADLERHSALSDYRGRVLAIARRLPQDLLHLSIGRMRFGSPPTAADPT